MTFPRYPKYKDSGVGWLGEVPEHWTVISIKWLSSVNRGASPRPIDDENYFDDEGQFAWVRIADVSASNGVLFETTQRLSELGSSLSVKIAPGELFVSIAGTVGKPCISAIQACIHDGFVYFPTLKISAKFLYRVFDGGTCYGGLGKWGTQLNLNTDTIGSIRIAVPPEPELNLILAFLDRETAKIDALVAKQQRLIELLKEKRQAVISHAVTKGLNLDAPMKDSGIEWLGEVPAHWEVATVRRYIVGIEQGWSPECIGRPADVDEWGVLKAGCVNRGVFAESENKALPETMTPIPEYEVSPGDVLISRASGSPELVGSTAYVAATRPKLMLSDKVFRIHLSDRVQPRFFVATFNSRILRSQIERAISGAEGLANNLPQSALRSFFFPAPPVAEQETIVQFLSEATAKLDLLTTEAQRAIDLLQERRTALISAAVTGQIDVRPEAERASA